jgi:hypothetical protein
VTQTGYRRRQSMTDDDGLEEVFGADFGLDSDDDDKTLKANEREKRMFQSEEDFLQQKKSWTPKVETREVCP